MNNVILKRSRNNIIYSALVLISAIFIICLLIAGPLHSFVKYLFICIWLILLFLYVRKLAIYPPLSVKNGILYIAPQQNWNPVKVPLAEIDHIEHRRHVFVNVIGRKYFTNSITITNKSGKEIHVNLGNASEKRCYEIDDFMKNAFGDIQIIEGVSKK
jgi:hypothetical protein